MINESNVAFCIDGSKSFTVMVQKVCSSFLNCDSYDIKLMVNIYSW